MTEKNTLQDGTRCFPYTSNVFFIKTQMSPYTSNAACAVIKVKVLKVFLKQKTDNLLSNVFVPFLQEDIDEYFKIQTYKEYVIKVKRRNR